MLQLKDPYGRVELDAAYLTWGPNSSVWNTARGIAMRHLLGDYNPSVHLDGRFWMEYGEFYQVRLEVAWTWQQCSFCSTVSCLRGLSSPPAHAVGLKKPKVVTCSPLREVSPLVLDVQYFSSVFVCRLLENWTRLPDMPSATLMSDQFSEAHPVSAHASVALTPAMTYVCSVTSGWV